MNYFDDESFSIESKVNVDPEESQPFTVFIRLIIHNNGFATRIKNLGWYLYYEERNALVRLCSKKTYYFLIDNIVVLKDIPSATVKRTLSFFDLQSGVSIKFDTKKKADSFLLELKQYLPSQIEHEFQKYRTLVNMPSEY